MSPPLDLSTPSAQSFRHPLTGKSWPFLIVEDGEAPPVNRWYQRSHQTPRNRVEYAGEWPTDWQTFSADEMVEGVADRNREQCFFLFSARPDFRIFLERESKNPDDKRAIRVMGSAVFRGKQAEVRLGYLSRKTAHALKEEEEIDARPSCVYLPRDGERFGLGICVLIRSPVVSKNDSHNLPGAATHRTAAEARNVRENVFEDVYTFFDRARDSYHCRHVSRTVFREVFDPYFGDALEEWCLTDEELNDPRNGVDIDLTRVMINEMLGCIVETLLEARPELKQ